MAETKTPELQEARKPISLSDLLAEVGNGNLKFQVLANDLDGQQWGPTKRRKATRLCFCTGEDLTSVVTGRRMGLVIWLDKEKCDTAMERLRAEP